MSMNWNQKYLHESWWESAMFVSSIDLGSFLPSRWPIWSQYMKNINKVISTEVSYALNEQPKHLMVLRIE